MQIPNTSYLDLDKNWVRQMFAVEPDALDNYKKSRMFATTGYYKFTDTSPGGNFAMNPPPQPNRYADPKTTRVTDFSPLSRGMGSWYDQTIDTNQRVIHMRFGTAAYNDLTTYFNNFYNSDAARVAKAGNNSGIFYNLGNMIGFVVILPFQPLILVGGALKWFTGTPTTKFYFLKPTMPVYWNAVQTMLNGISANLGLTIPQFRDEVMVPDMSTPDGTPIMDADTKQPKYKELNFNATEDVFGRFAQILPHVFNAKGGIDVYNVSTRAQRLSHVWNRKMSEIAQDANIVTDNDWISAMHRFPGATQKEMIAALNGSSLEVALRRYQQTNAGKNLDHETEDSPAKLNEYYSNKNSMETAAQYLEAELKDGAQFVTFQVEGSSTASESFSSSTGEIELGSKFNSISSGVRKAKMSFADGNTGMPLIDQAIAATREFADGVANSIHMSGLVALAGNAFADFPKVWESSSANLPKMDYTIKLRTPYGNKLSRLINIYMPLCMLIAGALPRSVGAQSYTSPFLVELYDRGRAQTRLGIIDSMSITRGTGNIGWTRDGDALGVDVNFSVIDLSSIMHMPLGSSSFGFGAGGMGGITRAFFGDDTAWTDYLAILSSLSMPDQVYKTRALARNWRRFQLDFNSYFSTSHAASWAVGTLPGRIASGLSPIGARG